MRSGWPHTEDDHGRLQAEERRAPFGPDISWPTGYSDLEYRDGNYRYPAPYTPEPPENYGEHPYAPGYGHDANGYAGPAASDYGYGDPGYSDLGYNGPASQDAGIAGTRTVRGFVEGSQPQPGYGYSAPAPADYDYTSPGYEDGGHIELAYPLPSVETYPAAEAYQQPWDYAQPLRYEDDQPSYPAADGYGQQHAEPDRYGSGGYPVQAYDPADYNGSELSRPGIDGPGYDLSGIIGTGEFDAVGYDDPGYGRLSYDDPRYPAPPAGPRRDDSPRARFSETRYDLPRYDDTRLDSLWLANEDARQEYEPIGYENDGFDTDGPLRSEYPDPRTFGGTDFAPRGPGASLAPRPLNETRYDMRALDERMDYTRFDVPAYDETRIENMRALPPADFRRSSTGLLPPPDSRPLNWPDETTIDALVADLYLDDEPAPQQLPAAYVRTLERREDVGEDTRTRRGVGRRRGRSGDRRQWMALGAIAVVAAGAIGGVLMKFVFSGPSGPAHTVVAPSKAGAFTRMPNLEKEMKVDSLRSEVMKTSAGQASNVVSAVYQQGSTAPGGNAQIFMFVGGKLSSAAPATSLENFTQTYPGATVVNAGPLGGKAACAEAKTGGEGVAMCVWFDNDSFGELVSPTMTTAKLATTLESVRPNLELYAK